MENDRKSMVWLLIVVFLLIILVVGALVGYWVFFRDTGAAPLHVDFDFENGWRDVLNKIRVSFTLWTKSADTVRETLWDGGQITIGSGLNAIAIIDPEGSQNQPTGPLPLPVQLGRPAYGMQVTADGAGTPLLDVTSGNQFVVTASGGAINNIVVTGKRFVSTTGEVEVSDATSITEFGERVHSVSSPYVQNEPTADAIANKILNARKDPRRVVRFTTDNDDTTRFTQALTRTVSDRITLVDALSSVNDEFYIERVEHDIRMAGLHHRTTFGCETVNTELVTTPLILDSATVGERLDEGELAY